MSVSSLAQDMPNEFTGDCVFSYDEQPGIDVSSEGVVVRKSTLVIAARKGLKGSGDTEVNFPRCDASGGLCAFVASAPLNLPPHWQPGPGEWSRGGYRFVAGDPLHIESVWGRVVVPVVVFHAVTGKPADVPLAVYFVDDRLNLVGFSETRISDGNMGSGAAYWNTSSYWLTDDSAPLECFAVIE